MPQRLCVDNSAQMSARGIYDPQDKIQNFVRSDYTAKLGLELSSRLGGPMTKRLDGKVAAITGGNQGIGLGIAQRFAMEGAAVAICYLSDKTVAEQVVEGLRSTGSKVIAVQADISKLSDGQRFVEETA